MDGAPSTFTFESLGVERAAAYGGAAAIVDELSDDDDQGAVAGDSKTAWCSSLATPLQATMEAAEAAFLASCPHRRAVSHVGICAAASAAAEVSVHCRTQQEPTVHISGSGSPVSELQVNEHAAHVESAADLDAGRRSAPVDGVQRPAKGRNSRPNTRSGQAPKKMCKLTLRRRLMIICMRRAGLAWNRIRREMPVDARDSAICRTWYRRVIYTSAMDLGNVDLDSVRYLPATYPQLDAALLRWSLAVRACGRRTVPVTVALLKERETELAAELGVNGFKASTGYICRWVKRNDVRSICLVGTGASADVAGSAARIAEIRETLRGMTPRQIYNNEETGNFYRCLPHGSYVSARERRSARGSKAMRAKDRVTAVLCVNADGSHKLPIAIIGKAVRLLCFRPPAPGFPLPYFSQVNLCMDGPTMAFWFASVFVQEVGRVSTEPMFLIMENAPSHGELKEDGETIVRLPPNTTSMYQPLDMGIISAVTRRHNVRLLRRVLRRLNDQIDADCGTGLPSSSATDQHSPAPPVEDRSALGGGAIRALLSPPHPPPPPIFRDSSTRSSGSPGVLPTGEMSSHGQLDRTARAASEESAPISAAGPTVAAHRSALFIGANRGTSAPTKLYSSSMEPSGATGGSVIPPVPPSAAEKVRLARVPPVQGLPYNPRPAVLSAPPARRTFLGPFVWRRPRKAGAVPANGDYAYEDRAVDPTLSLMDVCVMLKEEWAAVSETTIAQCWKMTDLLLADTAAQLRSRHGCYHPGLPGMNAEVAEIVAMMGACSDSARPNFPAEAADCVLEAVECLEAEDLPETVFETAIRIESTLDESDTE